MQAQKTPKMTVLIKIEVLNIIYSKIKSFMNGIKKKLYIFIYIVAFNLYINSVK